MDFLAGRRQRRNVVAGLLLAATAPVLLGLAGMRYNTTSSLARGIYWVYDAPAMPGRYASFCALAERQVFALARIRGYVRAGGCPDGTRPLLKRVMAGGGDVVSIDASGVTVNGHMLPHSRPLAVDGAGRGMPTLHLVEYQLTADEVLMMSDVSGSSFDARYFGPIPRTRLQETVRPLWTWPASH